MNENPDIMKEVMEMFDIETEKEKLKKENDKVLKHSNYCIALNETYKKKNHDYGDSFGRTFKQWGIASAGVRLSDKFNRFCSLAQGKEQLVDDESIKDTLLDMANYCIMTVMELEDYEE